MILSFTLISILFIRECRAESKWLEQAIISESIDSFPKSPLVLNGRGSMRLLSGYDRKNVGIFVHYSEYSNNKVVWSEQAKLVGTDSMPDSVNGQAGDNFGNCIDSYEDLVVVTSNLDDDVGVDSGSAFVFQGSWTSWTQQQKLLPSDGYSNHQFGQTVSISKLSLLIGTGNDDSNGFGSGSVYSFRQTPGRFSSWSQQQKLLSHDLYPLDHFGSSLAMYDDTAVIGAPGSNNNGFSQGSLYIFEFDNHKLSWSELQKVTAPDAKDNMFFGTYLSLYENTLVVGMPSDSEASEKGGAVYVYRAKALIPLGLIGPVKKQWTLQQKLLPPDAMAMLFLGSQVSVYGNVIAAGVLGDGTQGINAGATYLFQEDRGVWNLKQELYPPAPDASTALAAGYFGEPFVFGSTLAVRDSVQGYIYSASDSWSCLIVSLGDHFGDGWSEAHLRVTSPDGTSDTFAPHCDSMNPFEFRYCPLKETDGGAYVFSIPTKNESSFYWEISWTVRLERAGKVFYGDHQTELTFVFDVPPKNFRFQSGINVVNRTDVQCYGCGAIVDPFSPIPAAKSSPRPADVSISVDTSTAITIATDNDTEKNLSTTAYLHSLTSSISAPVAVSITYSKSPPSFYEIWSPVDRPPTYDAFSWQSQSTISREEPSSDRRLYGSTSKALSAAYRLLVGERYVSPAVPSFLPNERRDTSGKYVPAGVSKKYQGLPVIDGSPPPPPQPSLSPPPPEDSTASTVPGFTRPLTPSASLGEKKPSTPVSASGCKCGPLCPCSSALKVQPQRTIGGGSAVKDNSYPEEALTVQMNDVGGDGWSVSLEGDRGLGTYYYVTDPRGKKLITKGTLCGDVISGQCSVKALPDGQYLFRVGGGLDRDAGDHTWSFCGRVGRSQEQLEFIVYQRKCYPLLIFSIAAYCSKIDLPAAVFVGHFLLKGLTSSGLTLTKGDEVVFDTTVAAALPGSTVSSVRVVGEAFSYDYAEQILEFTAVIPTSSLGYGGRTYGELFEIENLVNSSLTSASTSGLLSEALVRAAAIGTADSNVLTLVKSVTLLDLTLVGLDSARIVAGKTIVDAKKAPKKPDASRDSTLVSAMTSEVSHLFQDTVVAVEEAVPEVAGMSRPAMVSIAVSLLAVAAFIAILAVHRAVASIRRQLQSAGVKDEATKAVIRYPAPVPVPASTPAPASPSLAAVCDLTSPTTSRSNRLSDPLTVQKQHSDINRRDVQLETIGNTLPSSLRLGRISAMSLSGERERAMDPLSTDEKTDIGQIKLEMSNTVSSRAATLSFVDEEDSSDDLSMISDLTGSRNNDQFDLDVFQQHSYAGMSSLHKNMNQRVALVSDNQMK